MPSRKALVVGIDHYDHVTCLHGCVNDAQHVRGVLERHGDGSVNFHVRLLTAGGSLTAVSGDALREAVCELFRDPCDIALLYFAGHGYLASTGGYLMASDTTKGPNGLALSDIVKMAKDSRSNNVVLVLDSCHSGVAGNLDAEGGVAQLREGMTILTASAENQYAEEEDGCGIFTSLFVDALHGAAANLTGDITPGSVYAHIDQSLGEWKQRPLFKTNVRRFISLRSVLPPLPPEDLRRITEFFPEKGFEFKLDPTYEPERADPSDRSVPPPDPVKNEHFAILQRYNRVNLVAPVDAPHMWHAAMRSKSCKLTVLGEHYRRLVAEGLF